VVAVTPEVAAAADRSYTMADGTLAVRGT
jgi:hypothetical protein